MDESAPMNEAPLVDSVPADAEVAVLVSPEEAPPDDLVSDHADVAGLEENSIEEQPIDEFENFTHEDFVESVRVLGHFGIFAMRV